MPETSCAAIDLAFSAVPKQDNVSIVWLALLWGALRNYKINPLILSPVAFASLATSIQLVSSATPLYRV
jgi:hypothetical protein